MTLRRGMQLFGNENDHGDNIEEFRTISNKT
jgi:hypothetical protein